ncbi:VWA domain-containing protein [Nonomuraea phyllanthi]|uniref:VWA domain-containing protein n=1 Tax=Nonomuraea phyllanthi TaxID=2219224 RepID=A0A5C4VAE0_9ACTN|nr:VWA domain-containing protein [Nonomuraea phyllanthi]KAB8188309.1 VWA domain-containing protein [Nonomuraea phyllanthi]QFY08353.1 VWA domain-containing protein [Nonomuraea phyllanthi]
MDELVATVTGFARTLRAAGVGADHERTQTMLRALDHLDVAEPREVYWAGRLTLCATPDDLPRYDRCFAAYFGGRKAALVRTGATSVTRHLAAGPEGDGGTDAAAAPATASPVEVLRHRDVARLTDAERAEVHRMLALLRARRALRRSRRFESARRGPLDQRRTIRDALRKGEIARLRHRRHTTRPRAVVLFVDVSGSMAPYAETLLRFAHALVRSEPRHTRVYSVGTRLTSITAELRHRDPGTALNEVSKAVPDWSGGTRLGEELREFLARYSARGAIVVIASDGWERGDPDLLRTQMARLARQAHRVIWVNPHKGYDDYQPLTGGMRAALPYLDDLVAGHSLAAFEQLSERLAHA